MIGKTNALAGVKQKLEMVNISLTSNQTGHEDLLGAVINLSYGEYSEDIVWEGSEVTRSIPAYVTYTVTFGDVADYKTPSAVSHSAVEGNSRSVTGTYQTEIVSVTLSADDGADMTGQKVTINGVEHTYDGTNPVEQKVAYGVTYSVVPSAKDGYGTPESVSYTASQSVRNLAFSYVASTLKVSILSNQSSDTTIAAVKATVTYGSTSVEVGNGETIGIPTDTAVTITFPSVDGYKAPSAITFTNSSGGVAEKSGTYYTEVLTVNVSADEGTISGYTVSVKDSSGNTLGSQTSASATYKIPSGTSYYVTASAISDYTTPSNSSTYTASSSTNASREVSMVYEVLKAETLTVNVTASDGASVDGQVVTVKQQDIANGVYIEDVNGKLWTESEWDGSVTPNGIAVVTDDCQFVVALSESDYGLYWEPTDTLTSGVTTATTTESAIADYGGKDNSKVLVSSYQSEDSPAYRSYLYEFPNGQRGYLGSAGEWQYVYEYYHEIVSALEKCGGKDFENNGYWTSTQYSSTAAWFFYGGEIDYCNKATFYNNRPFASLCSKPLTSGSATFTIPNGTTYEVSVSAKDGYVTPASQTFTAAAGNRTVTMQYTPLKITTIRIDQTITDPASMITRIVDQGGIEAVRANSHRYAGVLIDGVMNLVQLDDTDGTKTTDGANVDFDTFDIWMKLPQFYWKCSQYATDVWEFSVVYGSKPDSTYNEWDGKDLIGVYEAYNSSSKVYSFSGKTSTGSVSQANFKTYARNRGDGFTLVKWKHHCMMAMLFYTYYGNTNSQAVVGAGTSSYSKTTGATNSLGMTDTVAGDNGDSMSINFWGLENWWGNKYEFIDNVDVSSRVFTVTEDDGTTRTAGTQVATNGYITKMLFGENIDLIPTAAGGSSTTGFCDYNYYSDSSSRVVRRSYAYANTFGGVACVYAGYDSSYTNSGYGSRLAFRGEYVIS